MQNIEMIYTFFNLLKLKSPAINIDKLFSKFDGIYFSQLSLRSK